MMKNDADDMTKEEYLLQARNLRVDLESALMELEDAEAFAKKTTIAYSDLPVKSGRNIHRMEDATIVLMEKKEEAQKKIDELYALKEEISKRISTVGNTRLEQVLRLYYIDGRNWREVALIMRKHVRTVYRMKDEAIRRMK